MRGVYWRARGEKSLPKSAFAGSMAMGRELARPCVEAGLTMPKWYDSIWLGQYFATQDFLRRAAPEKLAGFEDAMRVFRCAPGYDTTVMRGLFDGDKLAEMRTIVRAIPKDAFEMHELRNFGRLVVHDWPDFNAMQAGLVDLVSELAGTRVECSYNFLSLYTHRGVCEPHLDAPAATWTLDVCIDQSAPWPIHFSRIIEWPDPGFDPGEDWQAVIKQDASLAFRSATLEPGDALLFTGPNQWHYRDPYADAGGKPSCDLVFFHFIPSGTAELVDPANWPRLFDVPGLAAVVGGASARRVSRG
jgi:hypothetical protein